MELTVIVVDDLEILDGRLSDSAVEVEHVGLRVVVPHGRLVVELDHALCVLVLPPGQQWLVVLQWRWTQQLWTPHISDTRSIRKWSETETKAECVHFVGGLKLSRGPCSSREWWRSFCEVLWNLRHLFPTLERWQTALRLQLIKRKIHTTIHLTFVPGATTFDLHW